MLCGYEIRKLDVADLQNALHLVWEVFLEFEAPEYSEEGIQEFKDFIYYESIKEKLLKSELLMWGGFIGNKLVGVIATYPCHICLLFVDKAYHKQGIARSLFDEVLDYYKTNTAHSEITVNSSPYAVATYHRLGFIDTNSEQTVNGIRFVPMKREINSLASERL